MNNNPVGLYREQTPPLGAAYAEVGQKALSMSVTEARYREDGYDPPYDTLPTKSEYVAGLKMKKPTPKPVRWQPPSR